MKPAVIAERVPAGPSHLISLLGEYSYLAANAHFATSANFSLAMSQVNHLLEAFGLRGISHARLEGLQIDSSKLPARLGLELKTTAEGQGGAAWGEAGTYGETRGEARALTSIAARLRGPAAKNFELVVQIRSGAGTAFSTPVAANEVSGDGASAITGVKMSLYSRAQSP